MGRCNCLPTVIVDPGPTGTPCKDCMQIASVVVPCASSVPPGGHFEIDLAEVNNTSVCTCGTLKYQILKTRGVENYTIADDILSADIEADWAPNDYVEITYKVICNCDLGTGVEQGGIAVIKVCAKDLCMSVTCSDGTCDPLTGNCV